MSDRATLLLLVLGACTHAAAPGPVTTGAGDGVDHGRFTSTGSTGPAAPLEPPRPPAWLDAREVGDTGVVVRVPPGFGAFARSARDGGGTLHHATGAHDGKEYTATVITFEPPLGEDAYLYDVLWQHLEEQKVALGVVNYWGWQDGHKLFGNDLAMGVRDHWVLGASELDLGAWITPTHLVTLTVSGMSNDVRVLNDYFGHVSLP